MEIDFVLKWFAGRLRCFGGKHDRSEKHIRRGTQEERFISKCRFCGIPMRRRSKRDWIVISRAEYRAEHQAGDGVLAR
jgi:hypothetical protein